MANYAKTNIGNEGRVELHETLSLTVIMSLNFLWISRFFIFRLCQINLSLSPQRHIQNHHQTEPNRKENCTDIRVLPLRHFRNQFFNHNIKHCSCCKAQ